MIAIPIITLTIFVLFTIFYSIDNIITRKRLEKNQREWDEYSKDMTDREKFDEYLPFCNSQKIKYGWGYYYLPRIGIGGKK